MFYLQALLLGALACILFLPHIPRTPLIFVSILWVLGVGAIYYRYGPTGQLGFYSNDQEFHDFLVDRVQSGGRPSDFQEFLNRRYPFIGPAFLLTLGGFSHAIALKFIAFLCFLANVTTLQNYFRRQRLIVRPLYVWLATGPVVFFFSLLALRETMMLACVTYVFVGKNPSLRLLSIVVLGLLRPHMGVAIILGLTAMWLIKRTPRQWYYAAVLTILVGSIVGGAIMFDLGSALLRNPPVGLDQIFGKAQTFQVFANFTGLQFLGADLVAIERSLIDLWLPRLVFPETIVVPVMFSIALFVPRKSIDTFKFTVLASIGFYLGITTKSDFNSFRQNLPFISVMAIIVIRTLLEDRQGRSFDERDAEQLVAQSS